MGKKNDFRDYFEDFNENIDLSDAALDAMLAGSFAKEAGAPDADQLESGDEVEGVVVSQQGQELIIEIGSKLHGVIDLDEFEGEDVPSVGTKVSTHFVRHDAERDVAVLGVQELRREVFWDGVKEGDRFEGVVTSENRGGLTIAIKGTRAFLPISQIERTRVEELTPYLGQTLQVEVTSVDRGKQDLIVSRRRILEQKWEEEKILAVARIRVGDETTGLVTRINQHGAFVDIGGVEGLLHSNKIHRAQNDPDAAPIREGDRIPVTVAHVDPEAGRVGLDLRRVAEDSWATLSTDYQEGDTVTGLVKEVSDQGATITLEEGIEGWIPPDRLDGSLRVGGLCRAVVARLNVTEKRLELRVE